MTLTTRNNYPYASYDFDAVRDPFEWQLNSTLQVARAFVFDQRYAIETRFELIIPNTSKWPQNWKFLKTYDIDSVLKITVNQLNADYNYLRTRNSSDFVSPASEDNIIKTMAKVLKSYEKIWGKNHFQIILLSTDTGRKVDFIRKLAKSFETISGIKIDTVMSSEFNHPSINLPQKTIYHIVLRNSYGKKIREEKQTEETQTSASFSAVPADAGHNFKSDGEKINQDARKHLKQFHTLGVTAQLKD